MGHWITKQSTHFSPIPMQIPTEKPFDLARFATTQFK